MSLKILDLNNSSYRSQWAKRSLMDLYHLAAQCPNSLLFLGGNPRQAGGTALSPIRKVEGHSESDGRPSRYSCWELRITTLKCKIHGERDFFTAPPAVWPGCKWPVVMTSRAASLKDWRQQNFLPGFWAGFPSLPGIQWAICYFSNKFLFI